MPRVELILYVEDDGTIPLRDWLGGLPRQARRKCLARIELLRDLGYELHRPESDYLRDGIYELRIRLAKVNYRILYFFFGTMAVVLCNGLTKEGRVPEKEIGRAIERKRRLEKDPATHMFIWEFSDGRQEIH